MDQQQSPQAVSADQPLVIIAADEPCDPAAQPPQTQGELMRQVDRAQRRAQVTALALEFHRTVSTRWCCGGIPEEDDEAFVMGEEYAAFNAACEHLRNVFSGENE